MENKPAETTERKERIFSAIQPSGSVTLGNYLGALQNWVKLQDQFDCIFALADLHTITVRQEPAKFRHNTLDAYALLLACGIDPEPVLFAKPCAGAQPARLGARLLHPVWRTAADDAV